MKENSNGTDTDVGSIENSIEEEIKIALDKFLDNKDKDSAILIVEKFVLGNYILRGGRTNIAKDSLRYILSDYKRVLKENEQLSTEVNSLKEENEEYKNAVNVVNKEKADWIKAYQEEKDLKENYIQKVKNKMEKDIKTNEHTILGRRNGKTLEYGRRLGRIEMCKELLESE